MVKKEDQGEKIDVGERPAISYEQLQQKCASLEKQNREIQEEAKKYLSMLEVVSQNGLGWLLKMDSFSGNLKNALMAVNETIHPPQRQMPVDPNRNPNNQA